MKKEKGYVVVNFEGTGMLEIQKIDAVDTFESDEEAVAQAMVDGIKIIPVEELPENFDWRYLGWIDTPKNREKIAEYCLEDKKIRLLNDICFEEGIEITIKNRKGAMTLKNADFYEEYDNIDAALIDLISTVEALSEKINWLNGIGAYDTKRKNIWDKHLEFIKNNCR